MYYIYANMAEVGFHDQLVQQIKAGKTINVLSLLQGLDPCRFVGKYKSTLLHLAAEHGNENLALHLINLGADVNSQNNIGETPLAIAVKSENENIVKLLLKANADMCVPDIFEKSVFDRVLDEMEVTKETIKQMILDSIITTITNKLLRNSTQMKETCSQKTSLREAIEYLDVKTTKFLFEYGTEDQETQKPLALEIVKVLINSNKWIDYNSIEVLMLALLSNEEMKNVKFDVNVCPRNKKTLLHRVAKKGNAILVELLIQRGAKVNAKDCYNRTPLFMAADPLNSFILVRTSDGWDRRCDCIMVLLENGADPQILTEDVHQKYIARFDDPPLKDINIELMSPVLMELVLHEASGRPIEQFMLQKIEKNEGYKSVFEVSKRELEEMKKIEIDESLTFFDFLTVKKVSVYAHIKIFMPNLIVRLEDCNVDTYYYRKLEKRCKKFALVLVVNQIFVEFYNLSASDIAEKIVEYAL